MSILTEDTISVLVYAMEMHGEQRYGCEPYHYHLDHVFHTYAYLFGYPDEQTSMLIYSHDLIEDTSASYTRLSELGMNDNSLLALELLTKPDGMQREIYIRRILQSKIAIKVKIADSTSNLIHSIKSGNERLINKYTENLTQLYRGFNE